MDPLFTKAQLDIRERIEILPQELIALVDDGTLDATIFTLQEKYGLTQEQVKLLENEIILVLTLFLSKETFADNVRESLGVDEETAFGISRAVHVEIFELVEDILDTVESARKELGATLGKVNMEKKLERREDLSKLAENLTQRNPSSQTQEASGVPQTPVEAVEPIRTMAQDMNRVHGYGAYREQEEKNEKEKIASSSQESLIPKKTETDR